MILIITPIIKKQTIIQIWTKPTVSDKYAALYNASQPTTTTTTTASQWPKRARVLEASTPTAAESSATAATQPAEPQPAPSSADASSTAASHAQWDGTVCKCTGPAESSYPKSIRLSSANHTSPEPRDVRLKWQAFLNSKNTFKNTFKSQIEFNNPMKSSNSNRDRQPSFLLPLKFSQISKQVPSSNTNKRSPTTTRSKYPTLPRLMLKPQKRSLSQKTHMKVVLNWMKRPNQKQKSAMMIMSALKWL